MVPKSQATTFFSNDFRTVLLLGGIGLMVSLGLVCLSLGTSLDLTVGSLPIDTTDPADPADPAVQAASVGH